ncbi:ubiquitin-protein ligase E3 [Schizosaccharomyces japonicus yFS275]|uniref:HECT-type E3 ubiquitin transferase n=1 Tax=Schizosaccharomyces japonicus (strain yFS275 / FY16936) TaxID=402676 RepID=B6K2E3_SCHJY|nr:ubiquitin-protein ligase E3 [Schizosaccharomyces japonicus yFS275]EEB07324.2 ubiquitin-protein ligase E3 [Schizosaccharomyces japonicus yFS275]
MTAMNDFTMSLPKLKSLVRQSMGGPPISTKTSGTTGKPHHKGHEMVIGNCFCCGSRLSYPRSVPCFRCTVCLTINDLPSAKTSLIPEHIQRIEPLSVKRLRHLVEKVKREAALGHASDDLEAVSLAHKPLRLWLSHAFRNSVILNKSFQSKEEPGKDHCGFDYDEISEFYRIVYSLHKCYKEDILQASEALLKRPLRYCTSVYDCRYILIFLQNPLLADSSSKNRMFRDSFLKRIFGLLSNLKPDMQYQFVMWFTQGPYKNASVFQQKVELVNSYISVRLSRIYSHAYLGYSYTSDWKINAAAQTLALLFSANNKMNLLDGSHFYNTMVDYIDLISDFDSWEQRSTKFCFCQYPFLLSMGVKMRIMEYDARRQMEVKAREAFFSSLLSKRVFQPCLLLRVRRSHLIEDSLKQIRLNESDLKKSLRIEFIDEEGVDAGGLRKEWFLLLCRRVFDPAFSLFQTFDDGTIPILMSVATQFKAFKNGFLHVCGGNALSLFRPEEIEQLVRGSEEEIDLYQLQSVCVYDVYSNPGPDDASIHSSSTYSGRARGKPESSVIMDQQRVIQWFWSIVSEYTPDTCRRLLAFVTGSDRLPATGIASLQFRISIVGADCDRYPVAHTCFNQLCLWDYSSREKLRTKLERALYESHGFGLK